MLQSTGAYIHLLHAFEQGGRENFSAFVPGEQHEISTKKGSEKFQ